MDLQGSVACFEGGGRDLDRFDVGFCCFVAKMLSSGCWTVSF